MRRNCERTRVCKASFDELFFGEGVQGRVQQDHAFAQGLVAKLPDNVKSWYGEIVFVKQRFCPWWPAYVYDPRQLDPESPIFGMALESIHSLGFIHR